MKTSLVRLAAFLISFGWLSQLSLALDADHDGMDDIWQTTYQIASFTGSADPDGDGRLNLVEAINWSNPHDAADGYSGWGTVSLVDVDANLLDDGWQFTHMRDGVPLLPFDDLDGDGRTNVEESIIGTHPWQADVPGAAALSQTNTPTATASELALHLPGTVPATRYRLQRSDDLVNWVYDASAEATFWGDGAGYVVTLPLVGETRLFTRWVLDEPDEDVDSLSGYAEHLLGTSDQNADSDGDGLPDAWEAKVGLNPASVDSDGDGTPDGADNEDGDSQTNAQEYAAGTHPRDYYNGGSITVTRVGSKKVVVSNKVGAPPLTGQVSPPRYFRRKVTEVKESLNFLQTKDQTWRGETPEYNDINHLDHQTRNFTRTTEIWDPLTEVKNTTLTGVSVQRARRYLLEDWKNNDGTPTHEEHNLAIEDLVTQSSGSSTGSNTLYPTTTPLYSLTTLGGVMYGEYFGTQKPWTPNVPYGSSVVVSTGATQTITTRAKAGSLAPVFNETVQEVVSGKTYTRVTHEEDRYQGAVFDENALLADPVGYQPAKTDAEDVAEKTTVTLSEEYLDTDLIDTANTKLASATWSSFSPTNDKAEWTWANNQTRLTRTQLNYKLTFQRTPEVTLTWTETFTPQSGGAATVVNKTWTGYNKVETEVFALDANTVPGTWIVSTPTVVQPTLKADLDVYSTAEQTVAEESTGALLPRAASGLCQTRLVLRKIQPLRALGTQKLTTITTGVRVWRDAAGTIPVTTTTVFPADVETILYADPNPSSSTSTQLSPRRITLTWTGSTTSSSSIDLLPFQLVSRDKFLAGTVELRTGWDNLELEFLNTTSGENLGRYGSLLGGGATKIYNDVTDILSEADIAAGSQSTSQKVWFVRSATNPRKLDFYTCFNAVGTVQVKAYVGSTSVTHTHTLTAATDFGDWITYVDDWCSGRSFEFLDEGGPGIASFGSGGGLGIAAAGTELNHYTRACLIPLFTVITQVEGMESIARGLFDGVLAGWEDDKVMFDLLGSAALTSANWPVATAQSIFTALKNDPVRRAGELMQLHARFCVEFIYLPLTKSGHKLKDWESIKSTSFAVWENIKSGTVRYFVFTFDVTKFLADELFQWVDGWTTRMLAGGEKAAFDSVPWNKNTLLNDLATTSRQMCFTFGYTVGYLCEQVAVGALSDGIGKVAFVMARAGSSLVGHLAGKVAFQIAARSHAIKKWLAEAAISVELRLAVERGLAKASEIPVSDTLRNSAAEVCEAALARQGYNRAVFGSKHLLDEIVAAANIQKLLRTPGNEAQVWRDVARYYYLMDAAATETASKGWPRLYNLLLKFEGETFIEQRAEDLFTLLRLETSAAGRDVLRKSLEEYATNPAAAKFWIRDLHTLQTKGYRYVTQFELDQITANGGKLPLHSSREGQYFTLEAGYTNGEAAKNALQLPQPAGQYIGRIEFDLELVKMKIRIGRGENDATDILEPLAKDFTEFGDGGGNQLLLDAQEIDVNFIPFGGF